jgi:hypothetical protein
VATNIRPASSAQGASPEIASIGLPPERHADRVIAQMLQQIALNSAHLLPSIRAAVVRSSDGSPRAQLKLEARVKAAGGFSTSLKPGKRGRYTLSCFAWGGWNPTTSEMILPGDDLPEKPWLVVHTHQLRSEGRGRGRVEFKIDPILFVTHHALSRAAQRIGARTALDLLNSMHAFPDATTRLLHEWSERGEYPKEPPQGWRVPVRLEGADDAVAVLKQHEEFAGLVVMTILRAQAPSYEGANARSRHGGAP